VNTLKQHAQLVAYLVLVVLVGLAFMRVSAVASQVEQDAVARTDLREREALLRANVLCLASNELRGEIRFFLDEFEPDEPYGEAFAEQECPPPPLDLDFQERRDSDLPEEPPGDSDIRKETQGQ